MNHHSRESFPSPEAADPQYKQIATALLSRDAVPSPRGDVFSRCALSLGSSLSQRPQLPLLAFTHPFAHRPLTAKRTVEPLCHLHFTSGTPGSLCQPPVPCMPPGIRMISLGVPTLRKAASRFVASLKGMYSSLSPRICYSVLLRNSRPFPNQGWPQHAEHASCFVQ
jgi:hypothetical protein